MSSGIPNIARINCFIDLNRATEWSGIDFSKLIIIAVGRRWTFTTDYYRRAAVDFPVILRWSVMSVGRSSIDIQQSLIEDAEQSEDNVGNHSRQSAIVPLATAFSRIVSIDPVTIKPAPLPGPIYDTLSANAVPVDGKLRRFEPVRPPEIIPDTAFRTRLRVRSNDADILTHTRQGCYLEYAIECATEAANSGYYSKIRGDVAYLRIRKTAANYLSVTQAGDELDMSTWEDSDNPLLLNFAVSKEGQLINFMQIEYYESEST